MLFRSRMPVPASVAARSSLIRAFVCAAQRVFTHAGYPSWQGLTTKELKERAVPFRATIYEQWTRLRRALPEMHSASTPFVKPKWDERTYHLVQDGLYEDMDSGAISVIEGLSDLTIMAMIRGTCSRPGALGKDQFDLSGAVAKWARVGGENVMSVAALTIAREGMKISWPDGTVETR